MQPLSSATLGLGPRVVPRFRSAAVSFRGDKVLSAERQLQGAESSEASQDVLQDAGVISGNSGGLSAIGFDGVQAFDARKSIRAETGVVANTEVGVGVIGFEGVSTPDPREGGPSVQGVLNEFDVGVSVLAVGDAATAATGNEPGTISRVQRRDFESQSLDMALSRGGRPPKASLPELQNQYGSPDRVKELGQQMSREMASNLQAFRARVDHVPTLEDVSDEAIRMLDAYINRTDELHPLSTELLAQGLTSVSERMPAVGARVSAPDQTQLRLPGSPRPGMERLQAAAENAMENQLEFSEARRSVRARAAPTLDAARGLLLDQRV